jgi:hypothetical protein
MGDYSLVWLYRMNAMFPSTTFDDKRLALLVYAALVSEHGVYSAQRDL